MKVIIYVNHKGQRYNWDELTKEKQREFTAKLNKQTANALGYKEKKQSNKSKDIRKKFLFTKKSQKAERRKQVRS